MLIFVLAGICGCTSKKSAGKSGDEATIVIAKDNSVVVTYTEEFKEEYYDKDELEAQIDKEIKEFNEKYAADKSNGMSKESLKLKNKKITLKLKFAGYKDYETYSANYVSSTRNAKLFTGTYEEAVAAGYDLTDKVTLIENTNTKKDNKSDEEAVNTVSNSGYMTLEELKSMENICVFYSNEGMEVELPGKVIAAGKNVVVGKNGITTSDRKVNYVIYQITE